MPRPRSLHGSVSDASRSGQEVHRDAGPWTPAVHSYLRHLRDAGFTRAPEPISIRDGREVLRWVPGRSAHEPWPRALRTESGLIAVARMVRAFHDAARTYRPPLDAVWRTGPGQPGVGQIIIHGDLTPANLIFRHGQPVAIVDWDLAEPGLPIYDLAHLAWTTVPIRPEPIWRQVGFSDEPRFRARLEAIARGYGDVTCSELADAVSRFMDHQRFRIAQLAARDIQPWRRLVDGGALAVMAAEAEWASQILHSCVV